MTPPHPALPFPCKVESYLYSLLQIAASERVVQWGFDETTIDGVSWYILTLTLAQTIARTLTLIQPQTTTTRIILIPFLV